MNRATSPDPELNPRIDRESRALGMEFAGIFNQETIDRFTAESLTSFEGQVAVVDFVPVFVRRFTRDRLRALAQAEGLIEKQRPEVLFVCTHNAGRSQMAAALLASRSEGRVDVRHVRDDVGHLPARAQGRRVPLRVGQVRAQRDRLQERRLPHVDELRDGRGVGRSHGPNVSPPAG